MESIWNDIKKPKFSTLEGDIKTDVLIIGGGMCGVLCAHMLRKAGVECILAEADRICNGITNDTTAKITLQHGLIYDKISKKYGLHKAQLYYQSQKTAMEKLKAIALEVDSDFKECSNVVYTLNDRAAVEREVNALEQIGCKVSFCEKTELPFDIAGAVEIENQANFHPLKFVYAIAGNLTIYENTKILALKSNTAITNHGTISAKKIIVATHFPIFNKHGAYFIKMYQDRSYVLALKDAKNFKKMYVDQAKDGLSFRTHNGLLLLGGGSHRTGKNGGGWKVLETVAEKYYPSAQKVTRWATQDCMTLDSIPYIGQYSNATPNLYVATGFNKWGMTSSMVSAMVLTDMICERGSEYEEIYSPMRSVVHSQLFINVFESVKGLATLTTPRCPHLGCALKYNKLEHSWDCPCHGSRFEKNGKLINNPATDDKDKLNQLK
ncbi:MAG: FAD-dependent oxidoreductase [Ruminococcaceae bacterium]|nr:FAD-dependent oxidoreductase [Oscillospiraceae bacterium]